MKADLVWFKRDLRVDDHLPLAAAARAGPVLCLYIYEPDLIAGEDFSARHLMFINDSLRDLDAELQRLGARLITRQGVAVDVFDELFEAGRVRRILTHQETTNGLAYARDRAVKDWAVQKEVEFVEVRQNGVVRALKSRDGWAKQWHEFVTAPTVAAPGAIADGSAGLSSAGILPSETFSLRDSELATRQKGGIKEASRVLRTFLEDRSTSYLTGLSSPVTAWDSCSRLSPYLAYGNLSIRTVYQHATSRRQHLQRRNGRNDPRGKALTAFIERLHWHCHFMQKLEDEPRIEYENMNRAFDGLREKHFNQAYFDAWVQGETGYPLVDACMRALVATGWINFRMRAMLVSFASYHLWLHWRQPALHLARCFVDYEPGIHFSQIQMQSGTTGINTLRIYSPVKQVADQDPEGVFIRQWLPALKNIPNEYIAEPFRMPPSVQERSGCVIGVDYPAPVVDHLSAYRSAQQRMRAVRVAAKTSGDSAAVFKRHGSRRSSRRRTVSR